MKKLLVLILGTIVLFLGTVSAQIPGRLDSLQTYVFTSTNKGTAGTALSTPAKAWQALNRGQTPVCQDFDAFEVFDTLIVWGGPEGAALPTNCLRMIYVERMVGDTVRIPMQEVQQREAFEKAGGISGSSIKDKSDLSQPRYWHSEGQRLFTHPKDSKTSGRPDSLFVAFWAVGHPLTAASDSIDIYPEYREALVLKACAILSRMVGNFADAATWETLYMAEVAKYGRLKTQ